MNETRFVQAAGLKEGVYPLNCLPLEFIMQTRIRCLYIALDILDITM